MGVDIRWMIVRISPNKDLGENPVQALMVIAPSECDAEYRKKLYGIYNNGSSYPLSISMKFIPVRFFPSQRIIKQSKTARTKQGIWQGTVETHIVDTISDLEWRPPHMDGQDDIPNLRTIILSQTTKLSNHNLFIAVDIGCGENLHVFVYPLWYEREAVEYIQQLPGWLFHLYREQSSGFFTTKAAIEGSCMIYNAADDKMITQND